MKRVLTTLLLLSCVTAAEVWSQARCDLMVAINNKKASQTTDAAGTNIRSGAGTASRILTTLKNDVGFRFHVTGVSGAWFHIDYYWPGEDPSYKDLSGWIYAPSTFIRIDQENGDAADVPIYSLFAEPTKRARKIETLRKGDVVPLVGCKGKWAQVKYGDHIGWLSEGTQCEILDGPCG